MTESLILRPGDVPTDSLTRVSAGMTIYKAPWAGGQARTIGDKLNETCSLLDWNGVDLAGNHDMASLINNAIAQALAAGAELVLPRGTLLIGSALTATTTSEDDFGNRFSMRGQGMALTRIKSALTGGSAFSLIGDPDGSGMHSYACLSGLSFEGNGNANAIFLENQAFATVERIRIVGFHRGFYLRDTLSTSFEDVVVRFCLNGLLADRNATGDGYRSGPNNLSFRHCTFGNLADTGLTIADGATVSFVSGSIENVGATGTAADRWGVKLTGMGLEGSAGASFRDTYFEHNVGWADVWIEQSLHDCAYVFDGCTFNRTGDPVNRYLLPNGTATTFTHHTPASAGTNSTAAPNEPNALNPKYQLYVANNIKVTNAGGEQRARISVRGCGFKALSAYVEDASRPYIALSDSPHIHLSQSGNFFGDATVAPRAGETPAFKAANSGNQTIPNGEVTLLSFNTTAYNEGWAYDPANSRFIAYRPVRMQFTVRVNLMDLAFAADCTLQLSKDGAGHAYKQVSPGNANGLTIELTEVLDLKPYEMVQAHLYVADGSGATVRAGMAYSSFEAHPV